MTNNSADHGQLRVVAAWCTTGDCPTIYETPSGSLVVQGATVDPESAGIALPAGESLVEIPAELLARITSAN